MTMHSFMSAVYSAFGWLDQPSFMSIYSTSTQTLVQRSGRIPSPARHWTSPKTMGCRSSWTHAARSIWNSSAKPCVVMDLCYAPLIFYNNKLFISSVSLNFSWSFLQYHCACAVGLCVGPRTDFPPAPAVTAKQANVRHEYLEVMTTSEIANETEYLEELSKYNQDATRHETRVIQERLACKLIDRSTHRLDLMFDSKVQSDVAFYMLSSDAFNWVQVHGGSCWMAHLGQRFGWETREASPFARGYISKDHALWDSKRRSPRPRRNQKAACKRIHVCGGWGFQRAFDTSAGNVGTGAGFQQSGPSGQVCFCCLAQDR